MNKLFSLFVYGLVAMVISFATSLQAAPNETDPHWKVSTTKDWQGFISKSKGVKVADVDMLYPFSEAREYALAQSISRWTMNRWLGYAQGYPTRFSTRNAHGGQPILIDSLDIR